MRDKREIFPVLRSCFLSGLAILVMGSSSIMISEKATTATFIQGGPMNITHTQSIEPARLQFNVVVSGVSQPIAIVNSGDTSNRIFIAERAGLIKIISNSTLLSSPFLDMRSIVNSSSSERGLLALAFHPQYETNGFFYTVHTDTNGSLVLSRFTTLPATSNQANINSRVDLLIVPHPNHTNHNGGTLLFGQDGYLYWSIGDGGGGGDPENNAQNLNSLLGKVLRLDIDSAFPYAIPTTNPFFGNPNARGEIWAYGLRNPWRMSFDRLTYDLYIGDVGQGNLEEINFQLANSTGGENYGWDVMEGSSCYNAVTCNQTGMTLPVAEYSHSIGCSVTGGYTYRGSDYPKLQGHYLYADFCQGIFFDLYYSPVSGWASNQLLDTPYGVSTFGEGEDGALYFADYFQGKVYHIGYQETTFLDVPKSHPYYEDIEILYANGFTAGCSTTPLLFCPEITMDRAQSAVFMLRGNFGSAYIPPNPPFSPAFGDDWSPGPWAQKWAQGMLKEGLTAGCSTSSLAYCPWEGMPRLQAAVFGMRLLSGNNYIPPAATGTVFADITDPNAWYAKWAEQAYLNDLLPACGTQDGKPLFCPNNLVNRGLGAYMIVRAKNLTMP